MPIICDECNTLHGYHRCHGENALVRGEPTGKPCECRDCRISDKLFPGTAIIRDDCRHKWKKRDSHNEIRGDITLKCKRCSEELSLTTEEWDDFRDILKLD